MCISSISEGCTVTIRICLHFMLVKSVHRGYTICVFINNVYHVNMGRSKVVGILSRACRGLGGGGGGGRS